VGTGQAVTVSNVSADSPHTFTVTGTSLSLTNDPGQTQSAVISLAPGTYPFICLFHESLGMVGTLVVTITPAPGTGPPSSTSGGSAGPSASPRATPSASTSFLPSSGPEAGGGGGQGGSAQGSGGGGGGGFPFLPVFGGIVGVAVLGGGGFVFLRLLRVRVRASA
jgi:hypothetical protein